ncbi:hypothetical protein glysoja_005791 [Glycine soja]|nr:hypothetical protein glysoja_005791 [Glycine soja]
MEVIMILFQQQEFLPAKMSSVVFGCCRKSRSSTPINILIGTGNGIKGMIHEY